MQFTLIFRDLATAAQLLRVPMHLRNLRNLRLSKFGARAATIREE